MAIVDVKAEVSGIVWKIAAGAGEQVGEDEPVVILESMKMEIPVVAPQTGKIAEILVAEKDVVEEGAVVARMEV